MSEAGSGVVLTKRRSRADVMIYLVGAAVVIALAALPEILNVYWLRVLTNMLMFAVLAQGINIIAGFVGYPAFGNVVFFGLGAYGMAVATVKLQAPFLVGLGVVWALSACVVLLIGPPLFRLRGHYFAIATLGLNEAARAIVENLAVTGGGMGLSLPLPQGSVVSIATRRAWPASTCRAFTRLPSRSEPGWRARRERSSRSSTPSRRVPETP